MCRASTGQIEVDGERKTKKFYPENTGCCLTVYIIVVVHMKMMTHLDICGKLGKYTYSPVDLDMFIQF